jgi:hypothetical protein
MKATKGSMAAAASDLVNWTPLTNAVPIYQFRDPGATNTPRRFYRLGLP